MSAVSQPPTLHNRYAFSRTFPLLRFDDALDKGGSGSHVIA
jgi:hypothetical protein